MYLSAVFWPSKSGLPMLTSDITSFFFFFFGVVNIYSHFWEESIFKTTKHIKQMLMWRNNKTPAILQEACDLT